MASFSVVSDFLSPTQIVRFDDDLKPAFAPAQLGVYEWQDLFFQWPGAQKLRVNGENVAPVAPGVFRLRFENRVGLAQIQPFCDQKPLDSALWVEVLSPKIADPRAHLAWWRAITGQLFDISPRLIWDFGDRNATRRNFSPQNHKIGVLEALDWLDSKRGTIEILTRATLATHAARAQKTWMRAAQIQHLESENWRELLCNPGSAAAIFTQFRVESENHSPERDFAVAFLRRVETALGSDLWPAEIGEKIKNARQFCRAAIGVLGGETLVFSRAKKPISSATGRAWLQLEHSFVGAGNPLWAACEHSARLRDVASLWEFWAFFALVEHLENALGERAILHAPTHEKRGLLPASRAVFGSGILDYNVAPDSYSTPLRPDFLWRGEGANVAFDAKFRSQIEENAFNGGDLHKMHAYRDALNIRAAIALHPGHKTRFFDRDLGAIQFDLGAILGGQNDGVGVWGIRPL